MVAHGELIRLFENGKFEELNESLQRPEDRISGLHFAVEQRRADLANSFLKSGVPPDCLDQMNRSPLQVAALQGDEETVRVLLSHGAPCNQVDSANLNKGPLMNQTKKTPLHHAAMQGHKGVIQMLLAHGADPNALDENGNTAQQLATKYGHFEAASILPGDFQRNSSFKWDAKATKAAERTVIPPPMASMPQWSNAIPESMMAPHPVMMNPPYECMPQYQDIEGPYGPYDAYPIDPHMQDPNMELYMPVPIQGTFVDYRRRNLSAPPGMGRPELVKQGNQARYKTELCRAFQDKGVCKYGEKCQFAHGSNELRSLPRHPKYKTEMCRTFHSTGICPYGPRCHFIHNSEHEAMRHYMQYERDGGSMDQMNQMREMMIPFPPSHMYDPYMRPGGEEIPYPQQFMSLPMHMEPVDDGVFSANRPIQFGQQTFTQRPITPSEEHLPVQQSAGPSARPSTTPSPPASISTLSPPSGYESTMSTRSPPTAIQEVSESLAGVRIASPANNEEESSPSSPHAQSPRRLPVFSAFKK